MEIEIAPECCVVCERPMPTPQNPDPSHSWIYLAGAIPVGSMVCSTFCLDIVVTRIHDTGRTTDGSLRSN